MDNADINRLARERDGGRLSVGRGREGAVYMNSRPRSIHAGTLVRHADTIADDYGDNGYGYTNPRDVVQYDLNQTAPIHQRSRRDSFESGRRPPSITGFNDNARSYDTRDRGPPPSTRGFDKLPGRLPSWDQGQVRMPVPPSSMAPMEPVQRPAPFDPVEPPRQNSSRNGSRARPVSLYHDREPRRGGPRDDSYEVNDEDTRDRRPQRHESYDPNVEQRGFGLRPERPERPASRVERVDRIDRQERVERPEKVERVERVERIDRPDRAERVDRSDRPEGDRSDHKGRDAVAAGLSIAGATLGVNTLKNANRNDRVDRDDRDDRRRSEYDEEPRRRRDRDDRDSVDLTGRDPKERRHREDDLPPPPGPPLPRDIPPPRDNVPPPRVSPPPRDKDVKERSPPAAEFIDLSGRDPKERHGSREEQDSDPERRERRRHRDEAAAALTGAAVGAAASAAIDSRAEESASPDNAGPEPRRLKRQSGTVQSAFNPKDTMDLKALKEALNSKDAAPKESAPRTPRQSTTKDSREVAEIRADLNERRPRDPLAPNENRQLRVVSPPREKSEVKPAKGILRAPREKFPEDPAPLREGVAPLKDAKKDGIPPDARWTKISRRLVNPEALSLGKERYEAREDFVIVLRVLSKDEVQGYAEVTQKIRGLSPFNDYYVAFH
jgi:hypothetical protein